MGFPASRGTLPVMMRVWWSATFTIASCGARHGADGAEGTAGVRAGGAEPRNASARGGGRVSGAALADLPPRAPPPPFVRPAPPRRFGTYRVHDDAHAALPAGRRGSHLKPRDADLQGGRRSARRAPRRQGRQRRDSGPREGRERGGAGRGKRGLLWRFYSNVIKCISSAAGRDAASAPVRGGEPAAVAGAVATAGRAAPRGASRCGAGGGRAWDSGGRAAALRRRKGPLPAPAATGCCS